MAGTLSGDDESKLFAGFVVGRTQFREVSFNWNGCGAASQPILLTRLKIREDEGRVTEHDLKMAGVLLGSLDDEDDENEEDEEDDSDDHDVFLSAESSTRS